MQQDNTRIWRSLLQLDQSLYAVQEREVPESEALPAHGLAVVRLLRWHGKKTLSALAANTGVTSSTMEDTIHELLRLGFIRYRSESDGTDATWVELAPHGVDVTRRIVIEQRRRIERSSAYLPEDQQITAATLLGTLAYDLISDSPGFGVTCSEYWTLDRMECAKPDSVEYGLFRKAQEADLDFILDNGPVDGPSHGSTRTSRCVSLGSHSEGQP